MKKIAIIIIVALIGILVGGSAVYLIYAYNPNKTIKITDMPISYGVYETYDLANENDSSVCSIKYNDKEVVSIEQVVLKDDNSAKYIVKTCYGEYVKDYNWRYYEKENDKAVYVVEVNGTEEVILFELIQSNHDSIMYVRNNKNNTVKVLNKTTDELKIENSSKQFEKKVPQNPNIMASINNYKKLNLIMNLFDTSEKFILDESVYLVKANQGGYSIFLNNKVVASTSGENLAIYTIDNKVLLVGDLLFGEGEEYGGPSLIKSDNILVFDSKGTLQYSLNRDLYNKKIYTKTNSNFDTRVGVGEKNTVNVSIHRYFVNCSNFYAQCDALEEEISYYKLDLTNLKLIK